MRWGVATLVFLGRLALAEELPEAGGGKAESLVLPWDGPLPTGKPELTPQSEVARLESMLARAQKQVPWSQKLVKEGVMAKVEAEAVALKVVRLEMELAQAQEKWMIEQREGLRAAREQGRASEQEMQQAEAAALRASEHSRQTGLLWQRAELAAAELNLQRQRQLFEAGVATRRMVERAEQKRNALQRVNES